MKTNITLFLALFLYSICNQAQTNNIVGLWQVEKVEVGENDMTPIAKWFKINADGSYQAGNGWLQSARGLYNYDVENQLYSASDSLDMADEFGAFQVSFDRKNMYWEREEEGMQVKVILNAIDNLPMSPADYLEGIWDLVDITKENTSILDSFDKDNKHKLYIRWDRVYINVSPQGKRITGYWHIHGHRSDITLMPREGERSSEKWKIEVNSKMLTMQGLSESNKGLKRTYLRTNSF